MPEGFTPRLVVTDTLGRRIVTIDKPVFTIGRRTESDLRLPGGDISRLHAEILHALPQPEVRNVLSGQGFETVGNSPEAFGAIIERDRTRWSRIVKDTGAKAD